MVIAPNYTPISDLLNIVRHKTMVIMDRRFIVAKCKDTIIPYVVKIIDIALRFLTRDLGVRVN